MPHLIVLGSSNAIPSPEHDSAHLAVVAPPRLILIDCAANPIVRLQQAELDIEQVTDVILTHFHPDHVSGLPLLLMDMWLMGRKRPLNIYGLHYTLDRVEKMLNLYNWGEWSLAFAVNFCQLPAIEMASVMDAPELRIYSSPTQHVIPSLGLRAEFIREGKSLAYSSDTEPCLAVQRLAQGVEVLIHEASGAYQGHSTAAQAGEIARQAEVGALYLIHYPNGRFATGDWVTEAQSTFPGPVALATDFMRIDFG